MTQYINSIAFTPTSKVNNARVAVVSCNSAIDSSWQIVTEGSDTAGTGDAVQARYAIVDNLVNAYTATIKYGILSFGVAPYTRRTFALPVPTPYVTIEVTSGIVTLTLAEANMAVPDEQNQQASSGGSSSTVEYNPFFQRTGATPVASELFMVHYFERAVQYQNNFNGIVGGVDKTAGVNPASAYACGIFKNGVNIGTLTFNTNGTITATSVG